MKDEYIDTFLNSFDYDIRKSNKGRWIDQKCTPDVVNIIADCILKFVEEDNARKFTTKDIWEFNYSDEIIKLYFSKPGTQKNSTKNEYDKFFAQPMELLAYANVLFKEKQGRNNIYSVNDYELLEYISSGDKWAFSFIFKYMQKVLKDSDMLSDFCYFFNNQDDDSYKSLKTNFENSIIKNTNINTRVECRRIFTKVINPLAFYYHKLGTARGRLSKEEIVFSDLLYNRKNFRDIYSNKPKNISRNDWLEQNVSDKPKIEIYFKESDRSKKFLKRFNDENRKGCTEVCVGKYKGPGTQMHHIFPKSRFPYISFEYENLIALSPSQHYLCAHTNNDTHTINRAYQKVILNEKTKRIKENIENKHVQTIYSYDNLIKVINEGFTKDYETIDNNYSTVKSIIAEIYAD